MDKKLFNKSSNFFKREGFYVILFVCLCIVATVAAVTSKNNKIVKAPSPAKVAQNNIPKITEGADLAPDNAIQVKKPNNIQAVKTPEAVAQVSKTVGMAGSKLPISGKVAVPYSVENSILVNSAEKNQTYKNMLGMVIQCNNAKTDYVCAVLDGKVEKVITGNPGGDGVSVTINHQNGYKTVYANLDPATLTLVVKEGQLVKQGEKLGKTGTSSSYSTLHEKYGNYLYLQVLNSKNEEVNPATYIKY
jgi:septal ring factor EnvC (AmiA/AmiB activator)